MKHNKKAFTLTSSLRAWTRNPAIIKGVSLLFQRQSPLSSFVSGLTNLFPSPLAGEGAQRAGEGESIKKAPFSPLIRATPTFSLRGRRDTYCKAFTLIELLVVVLIIGILAAVAVPQYQKAVEKSRSAEVIIWLKKFYEAQQVYKLANGSYTADLDSLSIAFPFGTYKRITYSAFDTLYYKCVLYELGSMNTVCKIKAGTTSKGYYIGGQEINGKYTLRCCWSENDDRSTFCKSIFPNGIERKHGVDWGDWAFTNESCIQEQAS